MFFGLASAYDALFVTLFCQSVVFVVSPRAQKQRSVVAVVRAARAVGVVGWVVGRGGRTW